LADQFVGATEGQAQEPGHLSDGVHGSVTVTHVGSTGRRNSQ
jgi:hypothetical protein